jgi:O-antigen/teichoic acid export membrane protein
MLTRLGHALGMDGAIAYAISARFWTIVSNIVTVALMVRYLSPVEQGYYFTLISLVALQVIFELGFSFVILQHAAHERAHLRILPDGTVEGDDGAHARLASILQLTVRWYSRAGIALAVILVPAGIYFFSKSQPPHVQVHWMAPWLLSAAACVVAFIQDPLFAFFEGCGEVREVAKMRFYQCVVSTVFAWSCMLTYHGLFAPGLTLAASPLVGGVFLWRRRCVLRGLLRHKAGDLAISWRHEVLPFQWRIAVSWICAYFTRQIFTLILFRYRNPVEAGQMGMTISVAGYATSIVLSWITTKAPSFGRLVAQQKFLELDKLFFRTLRQSMWFMLMICGGFMGAVLLIDRYIPKLASRIVGAEAFGLILLGTVGSVVVQAIAIYLRSFKREPLLWQSVAVAAGTLVLCRLTVATWGIMGISISYLVCSGMVALAWAGIIFRNWRSQIRKHQTEVSVLIESES